MFSFQDSDNSLERAKQWDMDDPLNVLREEFIYPLHPETFEQVLYFAGHSLGLMSTRVRGVLNDELDAWAKHGVEGHFKGKRPWIPYHESLSESFSKLVGAKISEVVVMNTLTVNLHLMLVSFYRPTKTRFKILIENNTFPSDKYAVDSQARFHGFDPKEAIVELKPRKGEMTIREEDLLSQIEELGDSLALVMLGNCNYLSGQCFPIDLVTKKAHDVGALCGFNLAHGAGNLLLNLHEDDVDFAVWCTYKYLNSGPGGLSGVFVHEKHHQDPKINRFEGWWGTNKKTRFKMEPTFDPIVGAEAWQLSNAPIFQLAAVKCAVEFFDEVSMPTLRKKGDHLTAYFEWLLESNLKDKIEIVTPKLDSKKQTRGSMLCLRIKENASLLEESLKKKGAVVDFREPNIVRIAPAPMYNSYEEVYRLVDLMSDIL